MLVIQLCRIAAVLKRSEVSGFVDQIHLWTTQFRCRRSVFISVSMTCQRKLDEANPRSFKLKTCHVFNKSYSWEMSSLKKKKRDFIRLQYFYSNSCFSALQEVLQDRWDWKSAPVGKAPESPLAAQLGCVRNFEAQAVDEVNWQKAWSDLSHTKLCEWKEWCSLTQTGKNRCEKRDLKGSH